MSAAPTSTPHDPATLGPLKVASIDTFRSPLLHLDAEYSQAFTPSPRPPPPPHAAADEASWTPPEASPLTRVDLSIPGARGFVLENVLLEDECEAWVDACEEAGFATLGDEFDEAYRASSDRMLVRVQHEVVEELWQRVRVGLQFEDVCRVRPMGFGNGGEWRPVGLNECFKVTRIGAGGCFKPHVDGPWVPDYDRASVYSVVIYLNDDFEGGETAFVEEMPEDADEVTAEVRALNEALPEGTPFTTGKHLVSVRPQAGAALVFTQDALHEGVPVMDGLKYVVRTEIIFARIDASSIPREQLMGYVQNPNYHRMIELYKRSELLAKENRVQEYTVAYLKAIALQREAQRSVGPLPEFTLNMRKLPMDLFRYVFEFLEPSEATNALRVSKDFYSLILDGRLWRIYYRRRWGPDAALAEGYARASKRDSGEVDVQQYMKLKKRLVSVVSAAAEHDKYQVRWASAEELVSNAMKRIRYSMGRKWDFRFEHAARELYKQMVSTATREVPDFYLPPPVTPGHDTLDVRTTILSTAEDATRRGLEPWWDSKKRLVSPLPPEDRMHGQKLFNKKAAAVANKRRSRKKQKKPTQPSAPTLLSGRSKQSQPELLSEPRAKVAVSVYDETKDWYSSYRSRASQEHSFRPVALDFGSDTMKYASRPLPPENPSWNRLGQHVMETEEMVFATEPSLVGLHPYEYYVHSRLEHSTRYRCGLQTLNDEHEPISQEPFVTRGEPNPELCHHAISHCLHELASQRYDTAAPCVLIQPTLQWRYELYEVLKARLQNGQRMLVVRAAHMIAVATGRSRAVVVELGAEVGAVSSVQEMQVLSVASIRPATASSEELARMVVEAIETLGDVAAVPVILAGGRFLAEGVKDGLHTELERMRSARELLVSLEFVDVSDDPWVACRGALAYASLSHFVKICNYTAKSNRW